MLALIATLIFVTPYPPKAPLKHCLTVCKDYEGKCWYEEKSACFKLCVDTKDYKCVPQIVNLGEWSPVPVDYKPDEYDHYTYPIAKKDDKATP